MRLFAMGVIAIGLAAMPAIARGDGGAEPFYKGRTISVYIGASAGGGFNNYARTVWPYMVKHIPGEPKLMFLNMPGAGSRKAAGYVAAVAPKDGTAVGSVFPGAITAPIFTDGTAVRYDPLGFGYIGSADNSVYLCVSRKDSGVAKFGDAFTHELVLGADAKGSNLHFIGNSLRNVLGVKFKIVSGYKGSNEIVMALERGEVHGVCGYGWSAIKAQAPHLLRDNKVNLLIQFALKSVDELTAQGVPTIWDFARTPEQRAIFELIAGPQVFGRPYFLAAGVPAGRLAELRRAFDATMADPAFRAEAARRKLDISPASGEEVEKMVKAMFATAPALQAKARDAMDRD